MTAMWALSLIAALVALYWAYSAASRAEAIEAEIAASQRRIQDLWSSREGGP